MNEAVWTGVREEKFRTDEFKTPLKAYLNDRRKSVFRDQDRQDRFLNGLAECLARLEENREEVKQLHADQSAMVTRSEAIKVAAENLTRALDKIKKPDDIDAFEGRIGASADGTIVSTRKMLKILDQRARRTIEVFGKDRGGQVNNQDIQPIQLIALHWREAFNETASATAGSTFIELLYLAMNQAELMPPAFNTVRSYLEMK